MKTKCEKNKIGAVNGCRVLPPSNADSTDLYPVSDTGLTPADLAASIAQHNQQIKNTEERSLRMTELEQVRVRKNQIETLLSKIEDAIKNGTSYPLVDEIAPTLPKGFGGWAILVVCCAGILGIEVSTVLNAITYATPLTQSPFGSVAMASPILAVPFMVKSFISPFNWVRAILGLLGLGASVVFAIFFALLFGDALGAFGVRMLASQLCAEALLLGAISAVIASLVHRPVSEKLRRLEEDCNREFATLAGRQAGLQTRIDSLNTSEDAAYKKAQLWFAAEQQKLVIIGRQAEIASESNHIFNLNSKS